ncbi:MAG: hypothetical protein GQ557_01005, partial [Mycoplasmataceae bacterium]|nr:hypothetical protein [Mycoplasmataceae bacterium]
MNTKIKLWFNKPIAKKVLVILSLIFLAFLIIAPITLIFTTNNFNQIYAYNRDTNSGTYEAFNEKVLDADGYQEENNLDKSPKNSYNVMEVSSNDRMISNVSRNKNTIGYVSIGTIGSFDEDGIFIKDEQYSDFDVLNFSTTTNENGVDIVIEPTYENIIDETYEPTRSFNEFFRVPNPNSSKRTDESEILLLTPQESTDASNSYWNTSEVDGDILISLSNEEKLSFAYYEWILYSQTAADIIKEEGEIIQQDRPNLLEPNEAKVAGNQLYEILYGIPLNLSELTPDDHEVINIEQVGSTSVQSLITTFEATLNPKLDPYNIKITHNQSGSGSASSLGAPAGSTNPY